MCNGPVMAYSHTWGALSVNAGGSCDGLLPGEQRLLMYKGPAMASYLGSMHHLLMCKGPVMASYLGSTVC